MFSVSTFASSDMDFEPKSEELWSFIASVMWQGLVSYIATIAAAFLRDLSRKSLFSRNMRIAVRKSRLSPLQWHRSFVLQYRDTRVFYYVELFRLIVNIVVCVIYVIGTYKRNVVPYIAIINRVVGGLAVGGMISRLVASESAIAEVFSLVVLADSFSIPSLFASSGPNAYLNFSFLRAVDAYEAYSRLERRLLVQIFGARRLFLKLGFQCFSLFYTLAAGIQLLEVPGDLLPVGFRDIWFQFGEWTFFNSWYFVIVTLSTVGYGDFSPVTVQGRVYAVFMIIVGIVIFTNVISELVEQTNKQRGAGWFVKSRHTRHVIVTGTPTMTDLVHFVSEFYSDPRHSNVKGQIVVLQENPPWSDIEWFQHIARNQFLQSRTQYLIGSVRNVSDLQRARIYSADAVFVLTSPSTGEDPSVQDIRTVMNILAIRNVRTDIPIYAQTLLADSNLETHMALTTASSASIRQTHFRHSEMAKDATYIGLFEKVLFAEYCEMPSVFRKNGRICFEDVLRHHKSKESAIDIHDTDKYREDLQKSQHVCLQEVHMALISGNIRVNGVGTLLSNMYLDVQGSRRTKEDPAWLAEYHMGAASSLVYAVIPEQLGGAQICDVAADLFHLGLVIVGISDPMKIAPKPVLTTSDYLQYGDLAIFLTYHEYRYVGAALQIVAIRYSMNQLRHPFNRQQESLNGATSGKPSGQDETELNSSKPPLSSSPSPGSLDRSSRGRSGEPLKPVLSQPTLLSAPSGDDLDNIGDLHEHGSGVERSLGAPVSDAILGEAPGSYIPDNLSGHVIIAMEGEAPLSNLPLLLQNLWRQDERKSMRKQRRARIVVVHPCITAGFRARFARFEKTSLFFLDGSPSSRVTWRKAKLNAAKAVATIADYTQPWAISDAQTIFTLLTLDASTHSDQDLFICSELVDEKSLEFLREPLHARRRGAKLGESYLHNSPRMLGTPDDNRHAHFDKAATEGEEISKGPDSVSEIALGASAGDGEGNDRDSSSKQRDASISEKKSDGVKPRVRGFGAIGRASNFMSSASKMGRAASMAQSAVSEEVKSFVQNAMPSSDPNRSTAEVGADPNAKAGAARARRGTLFSKSRYASGELLVQSSAITLLAREYIEPGFTNFYTNLLGTEMSSPGMKIRLVRIPQGFFDPSRSFACKDGRRLVRFNDIFKILIRSGVTPLGIYRSGDAPALIPSKLRRRRGPFVFEELESLLELHRSELKSRTAVGEGNGVLKSMYDCIRQTVKDILPQNRRDAQGRHEVHGLSGHFGEGYDSDSSSDEAAFNYAYEANVENLHEHREQQRKGAQDGNGSKSQTNGTSENTANEDGAGKAKWVPPKAGAMFAKIFSHDSDESLDVPGQTRYAEQIVSGNLLPYVYTMPDPNTWCAETDGIYVLCHPSFDLPEHWYETAFDVNPRKASKS